MSNVIEVLLKRDIKTLGIRGEVVKVSKGYARNYLFPQKLALLPTKEGLLELEREKKRLARSEVEMASNLKELALKIENASCTIEVKANEEGVLFGSVSPQIIIDALAKENVVGIKEEMIKLETPIKELGVYRIKIELHPEISSTCRLWVVEEAEPKTKSVGNNP
ncbi:MAG TPA: 50S ribosomal protein L9 [Planctomycetota bacterium]|nr:50S ribosomal protein L9 [Planctomycetota bacterium]